MTRLIERSRAAAFFVAVLLGFGLTLALAPCADARELAVANAPGSAVTLLPAQAKEKVDCPIAAGTYRIQSALSGKLQLDVKGASKKIGANVRIWTAKNRESQEWRVIVDDQGYCTIKNARSGKVLGIAGDPATGVNVQQQKSTGSLAQQWVIRENGSGYTLACAQAQQFLLDVADASARNGANVQLCAANGGKAQRWWLIAEKPDVASGRTIANGVYEMRLSANTLYAIDVANGSRANGANVQLYSRNASLAQRWSFKLGKDGFYSIRSIVSGKALESAGVPAARANVRQRTYSGSAAQRWAVQQNEYGSYTLVNKATGLALDIAGAKASDGTNVRVAVSTGAKSQRIVLKRTDTLPAGSYVIRSLAAPSIAIDVPDFSTKSGARLQAWTLNDAIAQRFYLRRVARSTYTIQSVCSGMYLTDQTGKVVQRPRSGLAAQRWKATLSGTGIAFVNVATGKRMALAGGSEAPGTKISTRAADSKTARFLMKPVDLIPDGYYTVLNGGGMMLDVANASFDNGANVQVWRSNGNDAQVWHFESRGNGWYKIESGMSGKSLEVSGGSTANGANVRQWTSKNSKAQRWKASVDPAGGLTFKNRASGKVLSAAGKGAAGANVKSSSKNGTAVQRWTLQPKEFESDAVLRRAASIAKDMSSNTSYLILVDVTNNRTVIFQGSQGNWSVLKNWVVSTGAPETATVLGDYIVQSRGYSFGHGYTCYYWTQFYGDFLFHSVLYDEGTFNIQDGRLGYNISQGCVRMDISNAKWIYDNIPSGTHVRTYR